MAFESTKSTMGGKKRRRGSRVKSKTKKKSKRGAVIKVKLKGSVDQVQNAAAALAGAANVSSNAQ